MSDNNVMAELTMDYASFLSLPNVLTLAGVLCVMAGLSLNVWGAARNDSLRAAAISARDSAARDATSAADAARQQAAQSASALTALERKDEKLSAALGHEILARSMLQNEATAQQIAYEAHMRLIAALAGLVEKPSLEVQRIINDPESMSLATSLLDAFRKGGLDPTDHTFQPPYSIADGLVVSPTGPKGERFAKALTEAQVPFTRGDVKPIFGRADVVMTIGANLPSFFREIWPLH